VLGLVFFDETALSWMGASDAALGFGAAYLGWRVWAYPFWFGVIALSDYFQGRGEPKTPMRVNLVMNLLNVILDFVLIFGLGPIPAFGVSGAAIATVISCAIGFLWILWEFVAAVRPFAGYDPAIVRRIVNFGTPLGLRYFLSSIGFSVFTAIVARLGDDALAAHQIAFRIVGISSIPGYGVSEAATVLAGYFHGAGRRDLVRRSYKNATFLAVGLMGAWGVVFWAIPESLFGVFQAEPTVLVLGASLLAVAAVFQIFDAITMTTFGALNGVGDTRYSMVVLVLGSWCVLVPAAWFFAFYLEMGVVGAWVGITVEIFILMVAALWRTRRVFGL
jgi:putative MATE family efflux protein